MKLWSLLLLLLIISIIHQTSGNNESNGEKAYGNQTYSNQQGRSSGSERSETSIPSPTSPDSVFSRSRPIPPPPLLDNLKKRFDSRGISIDKAAPDLQFGLSFTVPFVSLSTDKLVSSLNGKSGNGYGDPFANPSSLLKLNVGGLVLGAVVAIGALLFFPTLLAGKLPGLIPPGFFPNFIDTFMPGFGQGWNKPFGYGQYENNPHNIVPGQHDYPYGEYSSNYGRKGNPDERGRSVDGNGTFWEMVAGSMGSYVKEYWGETEVCLCQAMCLRGRADAYKKKLQAKEEKEKKEGKRGRKLEEKQLSSFDHVLEAIEGANEMTKNIKAFETLHKAYKIGQNGENCNEKYKKCKLDPNQIRTQLNSFGANFFN